MDKASTKILKILLFVGVFGYLQYYDVNRGAHSINSVTAGLMMACAAYLIASLFGIILSIFRNYLIAIIGTGAAAFFLVFKLDEVIANVEWLTEGRVAAVLGAFSVLCLVMDIRTVKRALTPANTTTEDVHSVVEGVRSPDDERKNATFIMRKQMKENPQTVFELTEKLEAEWGRKPSYEEVIAHIDTLDFPKWEG